MLYCFISPCVSTIETLLDNYLGCTAYFLHVVNSIYDHFYITSRSQLNLQRYSRLAIWRGPFVSATSGPTIRKTVGTVHGKGGRTMATIDGPGGPYIPPRMVRGTISFKHRRSGGTVHSMTVPSLHDAQAWVPAHGALYISMLRGYHMMYVVTGMPAPLCACTRDLIPML